MKGTTYGSQNTEEEGRAFVQREVVPPLSRASRSRARASAKKRVIAGASAVLVGAAIAATCGYVALSGHSVATSAETTKNAPQPLSLQATTMLESLMAQAGVGEVATFDSLDADDDGFVTKEEYVAHLQELRDEVLAKLEQSNLAGDAKQSVAEMVRDDLDEEAACVTRVFDSSGDKAVDRDAFKFVRPLIVSFCKKARKGALTTGIIPAVPTLPGVPGTPDQQQGGGGGQTIDGDVPAPTTPGGGPTIDGDVVEPTSGPSNPDDITTTDSPSPNENEESSSAGEPPSPDNSSTNQPGVTEAPGSTTEAPGSTEPPSIYDDNNPGGLGLGGETTVPGVSPDATPTPTGDGPSTNDLVPATGAPGDDIFTPLSNDDTGSGLDDEDHSTAPASTTPGGGGGGGEVTTTPSPATPGGGDDSSQSDFVESESPSTQGPNSPGGETPSTNAPPYPDNETPEPWDPAPPSDPNVDAADVRHGPLMWDPSLPTLPPADEVVAVPETPEPGAPANNETPTVTDAGGVNNGETVTTAPPGETATTAPTAPPGSLTALIDNALKDLALPNDGTNGTAAGASKDLPVVQKFLDELNPTINATTSDSTSNGTNPPPQEQPKSLSRLEFEALLKKQLEQEIKEHKQRLAYANLQIKKNAFVLELIEECVTHAGRRFEMDPSFSNAQAIHWIKNKCLVFPHAN